MCSLDALGLQERPAGDQHVRYSEFHEQLEYLDEYDKIIQNQLKQGIVDTVSDETEGERDCYLLHKAVITEAAQSTKMRIVFNALAKANQGGPSLNDYLEKGPTP